MYPTGEGADRIYCIRYRPGGVCHGMELGAPIAYRISYYSNRCLPFYHYRVPRPNYRIYHLPFLPSVYHFLPFFTIFLLCAPYYSVLAILPKPKK